MTREEEIKAAIVVTPQMNQASAQLGMEMSYLVSFVHSVEPSLERHEATLLAAAVVEMLPQMFEQNPEMLNALTCGANKIIAARGQADDRDQPDQN